MIRLALSIDELDFLPPDPFAVKIKSYAITYGFSYNFVSFYVQICDDTPVSALCRLDNNITLYSSSNSDFEELREFFDVIGFDSIQSYLDDAVKIGYEIYDSSYIVSCRGLNYPEPENFCSERSFREIYLLLNEAEFEMGDYNSFISDICARINKGTSSFGGIASDYLDCCAFKLFETENCILLGAVATRAEKRGNGLASALVRYMASGEKPVFLLCRNDGLLDFYINCGFKAFGKWAVIYRR